MIHVKEFYIDENEEGKSRLVIIDYKNDTYCVQLKKGFL